MKTKLLLLLLLANFSIYAQINLVPNSGFETWTGNIPQSWTVANSVISNADFASGQWSAKLSYTTVSPKITTQVPMKAGVTYTVKYKYKYIQSNYSGDHPIALNISKAGSSTTLSSSTFATNNLWTSKETTFTPDADLSYDLSFSTFSFDSATFYVLIDDVEVYVKGTEQYTLIPDVEFEKRLINLGLDSGATDGKVLTSNINTVKTLSVDPKIVADLTGIQDFAALETLTCNGASYYADGSGGDGNLKVLDVSKNLNLLSLSCRANKISSIDVSKNTKLVSLEISGNKIATLNVTSNLSLQRLEFGSTLISSIDISKNLNLDRLDCSSTKITILDLSKNLNLSNLNCSSAKISNIDLSKNILLGILNVSSNQLTSLDVSKNINLLTLYCGINLLTSIDVSKNIKLVNFSCFENKLTSLDVSKNTAIATLSCYTNQITALDVTKNIALNSFNCSSNKITALDVSKNNALNYFVCSANELTSLNLKNGKNTLLKNANVSLALNPKLSCITVDDVAYANANWADKKDSVTYFSTYDCSTTTQILDAAFEDKLIALGIDKDGKNGIVLNSSIAAITSLDVSNSSIVNLSGIERFTALTTLNASGNLFTKIDLSKNTIINNLNVSNNPALKCIQVADVAATANWTVNKDATASFSLDCNVYTLIPDPKFEEKLIALGIDIDGKNGKVNTESISGITSLDISFTEIADLTGIQDFANLTSLKCNGNAYVSAGGGNGKLTKLDLTKNTKLTTLNCSYNQLTSLDLSKNTLLNNINISYNRLSVIDFTANTAVTTLSVNNNVLTSIDLSQNTALLNLYLDINKLSTIDLSKNLSLSAANFSSNVLTTLDITKNTALTSLDCSSNKLSSIDLSKNIILSSLRIYQSGITSLDVSKNLNLKTLYCSNNTLTVLDVTKNTVLS
jgi:Leucine-rich repeat (LRR) protein